MNRALVPTAPRPAFDANTTAWADFDDSALVPAANGTTEETEDVEVLEERALRVKREAQNKRKPIPPFVQKLSR
jgi:heat shock transcription factor